VKGGDLPGALTGEERARLLGGAGGFGGGAATTTTPAAGPQFVRALTPDERASLASAHASHVAPGADGMTGATLVELTSGAGLDKSDMAKTWSLASRAGRSTLDADDYALFMHLLNHRVAGGELPGGPMTSGERARILGDDDATVDVPSSTLDADAADQLAAMGFEPSAVRRALARFDGDAEKAADFLAAGGGAGTAPSSPSASVEELPAAAEDGTSFGAAGGAGGGVGGVRLVVKRVGGIKDASKLQQLNVRVTLCDGNGAALAAPRTMLSNGARGDEVHFNSGNHVDFETLRFGEANPPGLRIICELRHFKAKEKKMSVKCWAFIPAEVIEPGGNVGFATMTKPTDAKLKRLKAFNGRQPDFIVAFEAL
jgi:hypothetical protein